MSVTSMPVVKYIYLVRLCFNLKRKLAKCILHVEASFKDYIKIAEQVFTVVPPHLTQQLSDRSTHSSAYVSLVSSEPCKTDDEK